MRIRESIVAGAITLILFSAISCAKQSSGIIDETYSKESFEKWIAKYAPRAGAIEEGVYVEFLDRASNWNELSAPVIEKNWVLLDFYGSTLSGSVFGTRDSLQAKLIGIWQYPTHFVPQVLAYSTYNSALCRGLVVALARMRVGDHARIYIPANKSLSNGTFYSGYLAMSPEQYQSFPVWYEVKLKDIITDPLKWEDSLVNNYARVNWNYTLADTIAKGLYMRKTVLNPAGDTITTDSTTRVWQVLRFLDGQLLNTNIDSVAKAAHYSGAENLTNSDYQIRTITPDKYTGEYSITNQVYKQIIPRMRTGEQVEVVATSIWGVGQAGKLTEVPQIGAFEPIRYHFKTLLRTDSIK